MDNPFLVCFRSDSEIFDDSKRLPDPIPPHSMSAALSAVLNNVQWLCQPFPAPRNLNASGSFLPQ
jgi:hypothetical protein